MFTDSDIAALKQIFHHNLMLLLNTVISSQTPAADITLKNSLQALFDSVFCPVYIWGSINFSLLKRSARKVDTFFLRWRLHPKMFSRKEKSASMGFFFLVVVVWELN